MGGCGEGVFVPLIAPGWRAHKPGSHAAGHYGAGDPNHHGPGGLSAPTRTLI